MNSFSSFARNETLDKLSSTTYDLLIIGGGITGSGIALDAQARGMKTALVEMQDFASGTSSRSTKLIHGGLRYLKQLEFALVAEVGKERAIVYKNARHVTRPEKMLLPILKKGSLGKLTASLGVWLYDFLAGVESNERMKVLDYAATLLQEPLLNKKLLKGGIVYYEYRTDDARLTIEILKEAVSRGLDAINYVDAKSFVFNSNKIVGLECKDRSGRLFKIYSKNIVNATGPWVDNVDKISNAKLEDKLLLTKGVHIVIDRSKLPIEQSVYFDVPDGRMIFAIPRSGKVYIGTTDTAYNGDIKNPPVNPEDKQYLLNAVNNVFPDLNLEPGLIESAWAGLRPLIKQNKKSSSSISRKDEIFIQPSGLITIAGGKLTGYRKMAERVVDRVAKNLTKEKLKFSPCTTQNITLSGGEFTSEGAFKEEIKNIINKFLEIKFSYTEAKEIAYRYGTNCYKILELIPSLPHEIEIDIPLSLKAEIFYCIQYESALTLSDYFIRRTGALYFNIGFVQMWKIWAAKYMSLILGWSEEEEVGNLKELDTYIANARS